MKLLRCLAVVAAISAGVSVSAKCYELVDLGRPPAGEGEYYLNDPILNNAGTVALTTFDGVGNRRVFVFRAGAYAEIPNATGWGMTLTSINDYDEIVGGLYRPFDEMDAWPFRDGYIYNAATAEFQLLSTSTGLPNMSPVRINNSGTLLLADDTDDLAVVYQSGALFRLGELDDRFSVGSAWELNNADQILFRPDVVFPSSGVPDIWESNQYVYTLGDPVAEPLPEGTPWTPEWTYFSRINDHGLIAGGSEIGLVLYQGGETTTVAAANVSVAEINNDGAVVGLFGPVDAPQPFLYDGKSFKNVNELAVWGGRHGWTLVSASGINDLGQIVGLMRNRDGAIHVFLLNPKAYSSPLSELEDAAESLLRTLTSPLLSGTGLF